MFSRLSPVVPLLFLASALAGCSGNSSAEDNEPPVASFTVVEGSTPGVFLFDGTASSDPNGDALTYTWTFGDGSDPVVTGAKVEYEYVVTDTKFNPSLVVRDKFGAAGAMVQPVTLGSGRNLHPEVGIKDANRWVDAGPVVLDGSASRDEGGDAVGFEWIFGPRVEAMESAQPLQDACGSSSADPFVFSTGCLAPGQNFTINFAQTGTYNYHCHPHPWMKARLVVTPNAPVAGTYRINIQDFDYSEAVIQVQPGTTVTFVNADPVPHTATVEDFTPGESVSTTPVLNVDPPEGEYLARLIVDDYKGGRMSATFGVKVGGGAPANPDNDTWEKPDATPPQLTSDPPHAVWYNLTHRTKVDGGLTWTDPGGLNQVVANLSFVSINAQGQPGKIDNCQPFESQASGAKEVNITCIVDAGSYKWRVHTQSGALIDWKLNVLGYPYASPGFGDSTGGGHHH